jgi:tetratricopeptide (TPR) repeat protein
MTEGQTAAQSDRPEPPPAPEAPGRGPFRTALPILAPLLILAVGWAAYHNSLRAPFLFDDGYAIVDNSAIRHPLRDWKAILSSRPVVYASLAVNYALGELNPLGYHLVNLAVHLLAGLVLYGLVRRTLLLPALRSRYGEAAPWLALATALLWVAHPLQTESVTYLIQRAESLAGLFSLLTLYCLLRGAQAERGRAGWYGLALAACALGMGSKETAVTIPLAALLYDRAFLAPSWREVGQRRWPLYAGLAGTWALLAVPLRAAVGMDSLGAADGGFGLREVTPLQYALSQPGVLLHYLRLSVWPWPRCLDYAWPVAATWQEILPPALVVGALVAAAVAAWFWKKEVGFVGLVFFLVLAPTSSIMPILDLAVEHRMYLALAAEIVLVVLSVEALFGVIRRRGLLRPSTCRWLALGLTAAAVVGLGAVTVRRNEDYRSELVMWGDVVAQRPDNPRARNNYGKALLDEGRVDEAIAQCAASVRLRPGYVVAYNNLGLALVRKGRVAEAVAEYEKALTLQPGAPYTHNNLGLALAQQRDLQGAVREFSEALRLRPTYVAAHNNLGGVLQRLGKPAEALAHYRAAVEADPTRADSFYNLGLGLAQHGDTAEAVRALEEALRLRPDHALAHNNLGLALAQRGRTDEAIAHFREALRLRPDYALAHNNLGQTLLQRGQVEEAISHLSEAVRLRPDFGLARQNLQHALAARAAGRPGESPARP